MPARNRARLLTNVNRNEMNTEDVLAGQGAVVVPNDFGDFSRDRSAPIGKLGGIDTLVNDAGMQFAAPVEEFPIEK